MAFWGADLLGVRMDSPMTDVVEVEPLREQETRRPPEEEPCFVTVHIYDLAPPLNDKVWKVGLGLYHSGIELSQPVNAEYWFQGHNFEFSGVLEVSHSDAMSSGIPLRASVNLGASPLSHAEIKRHLEELTIAYRGNSYHPIHRNCNSFVEEFVQRLKTPKGFPGWVNRVANTGKLITRMVPEAWIWWGIGKILGTPIEGFEDRSAKNHEAHSSSSSSQKQTAVVDRLPSNLPGASTEAVSRLDTRGQDIPLPPQATHQQQQQQQQQEEMMMMISDEMKQMQQQQEVMARQVKELAALPPEQQRAIMSSMFHMQIEHSLQQTTTASSSSSVPVSSPAPQPAPPIPSTSAPAN